MKKFLIFLLVLVLVAALAGGLLYFFWTADNFAALAQKKAEAGNYEKASEYYEKALELDPSKSDYALALARVCRETGRYTQGERALVNSIRTAPEKDLYLALSQLYVAQDKLMDAQMLLDSITDSAIGSEIGAMRPEAPVFSPDGGEYDEYISVSIAGDGNPIYYSDDAQYPSLSRTLYREPLVLPAGDTHISAIAVNDQGLVSPLVEADWRIVGVVEELDFVSPELEAMVRETLFLTDSAPIMTMDLWQIHELTVPDTVTDYTDLQYFTSLTSLTIHDSSVTDYSFLQYLTELETLDLSGSLINSEALGYVGTCTTLTTLNLSQCGISNILPLAETTEVTVLDLSGNSITNIGVLSNYKHLTQVKLDSNAISDLAALEGLTELTHLTLSQNSVSSLAPLAQCTAMEELDISGNQVKDLSPLKGMTQLSSLKAQGNQITDIAALSGTLRLTHLDVADNTIADIRVVGSLPALTYLDISHNTVTELPTLSATSHLQQFYAAYNQLSDISPLAGLKELTYVNVDYNEELEDIECLQTCEILVQVDAFGTKVKEVKVLTDRYVIVNYDPSDLDD